MEATGPAPIGLPPGASLETAGEDEAKYSSNNVVVRKLIGRLLDQLRVAAGSTEGTWVDVGIGEGLAVEAMRMEGRSLVGVEYRHDKLTMALNRLPEAVGVRADAGMLPFSDHSAEVVTCLEVLEHLEAPNAPSTSSDASAAAAAWCPCPGSRFSPSGILRGKDVGHLGNNPEHIQQFRPATLRRLLGRSFAEVSIRPCFPWIIGVAAHSQTLEPN